MPVRVMSPNAELDWSFNWNDGYLSTGETIATSSWTVNPSSSIGGLRVKSSTHDGTVATANLAGAVHNATVYAINYVTTINGRTDDRTLVIKGWTPR